MINAEIHVQALGARRSQLQVVDGDTTEHARQPTNGQKNSVLWKLETPSVERAWYLSHSKSTTTELFRLYIIRVILHIFTAHARNGYISTSGQKSDITIVFLDQIFL